jgi:hypothetical protein
MVPAACGVQAGQHAVEVHAALFRVVVGVGAHFKAGVHKDGAVVFPAGVRDQHFGVGADFLQKVGTDFQAARAANGLHGGHTARLDHVRFGTKHQRLDGVVIGHDAVNRQVATRGGGGHHGFFSRLHALQQGQFAVVVEVHAHAQVHLVGVGVGVELLVQTQNGVAGGHFDGGKQRHGKSLDCVQWWQETRSSVRLSGCP